MLNMLKETQVYLSSAAVAAGTTDVDGGVIDMQNGGGFDGIMGILTLGDVADTSVITMTLRESDNSDGSSSSAVSGASVDFTAGATSADSKILLLDVCKRTKRYVFFRVTRATANAPVAALHAIAYKAHVKPTTQPAVVIDSTLLAA